MVLQLLDLVQRSQLLVNLYVKGDTQRLTECATPLSAATLGVRRGTSLRCVHEQLLLFADQEVQLAHPQLHDGYALLHLVEGRVLQGNLLLRDFLYDSGYPICEITSLHVESVILVSRRHAAHPKHGGVPFKVGH